MAVYVRLNHWEKPIAKAFTALLAAVSVWTAFTFPRMGITDPTLYVGVTALKYVGVSTAPVFVFFVALIYADGETFVTRRTVVALLIVPALTVLVIATTQIHGLYYSGFTEVTVAGWDTLQTTRGTWFWGLAIYGWGLLALGSFLLLRGAYRLPGLYRTHTAIIATGVVIPWAVNLAYVFAGWPHPAVDPTPLGFAAASVLWMIGVLAADLVDVSPIARSRVVATLDSPTIVIDTDRRIVDVNDAARLLLATSEPYGADIMDVLPTKLARHLTPAAQTPTWQSEPLELSIGAVSRWYQYRFVPLGPDGSYGNVLVLTDVTELMEVKQRVERQNEVLQQQNDRLDDFASVISHDLRSPLNVANGRLELLGQETNSEHVEPLDRALDRMAALVEDLLTLAQQGKIAGETEAVDLAEVVSTAWAHVDSGDATLETSIDRGRVRADESRLTELFENLFRNAVEHGGPAVTVRVGSLPDGFYVEDTGPGIPESDRESIFEYGYTTSEDGTGFGLSIVETIAEAHGWDIRVTGGCDGGARFELRTEQRSEPSPGSSAIGTSEDYRSRAAPFRSGRAPRSTLEQDLIDGNDDGAGGEIGDDETVHSEARS